MLTPTKFFTRAISCSLDGNGLQLEKATDIGDQLADTYEQCAEDQTGYGVSDVFRGGHYFALLVGGLTFQRATLRRLYFRGWLLFHDATIDRWSSAMEITLTGKTASRVKVVLPHLVRWTSYKI